MCNLIGYVKEYGNESFKERPFGAVDALVLSQLSYLHWNYAILELNSKEETDGKESQKSDRGVALKNFDVSSNCPQKMRKLFENSGFDKSNRRLLYEVSKSRRFADIEIKDYDEESDSESNKQFCGMTFRISDKLSCIVFRGTDMTINGWKENFSMIYRHPVPAQERAKDYLNQAAKNTKSSLVICGHSKGGNLAVYAAVKCDEEIRDRIKRIYNFDGPGFCNDFFSLNEYLKVSDRIRKYVAPESYVGLLLYNYGPEYMVKCKDHGMAQHDAFKWEIGEHNFIRDMSKTSKRAEGERLNERILALSAPKAKVVIDSFFDVSSQNRIENINEINAEYVLHVLKNLSEQGGIDLASVGVMKDMVIYMMAGRPEESKRIIGLYEKKYPV